MLTGKIFSWKIRHDITTFWGWKPYKKNIQPIQPVQLWQKLSNMSINSALYLKTRFVWEKKKRIRTSEIYISVRCSLRCEVPFFFWVIIFKAPSLIFCFMLFTKVLMKELARILIHVHKIFNRRVSFKILLLMCLAILEKKL